MTVANASAAHQLGLVSLVALTSAGPLGVTTCRSRVHTPAFGDSQPRWRAHSRSQGRQPAKRVERSESLDAGEPAQIIGLRRTPVRLGSYVCKALNRAPQLFIDSVGPSL